MSGVVWTAAEAGLATGARVNGDWIATGVSIDTRTLRPGDLFVALKDVRDGHDFVDAAFAAGAAAALVSRDMGRPGLVADDVLAALGDLGRHARARAPALCAVAITGSVGKTSCKEMLARIFAASGPAHWSDKSFNNHWGVPLTLARMPRETRRAAFEIGMSTPGEIAPRSLMVRPHIAIITKIAAAHLEGLGSVEAIAAEKAGIFAGLEKDGVGVLPHEDPFFDYLAAEARRYCARMRIVSFGRQGDVRILGYETDGVASRIEIDVMGERAHVVIDAVGRHWASNVALAMAVAKLAGIATHIASADLSGYAPPSGRGVLETLQTSDGGTAFLVDDSYNANPESMRAALEAFALRPGTKLICLGEMRELGPEALKLHAELAPAVLASQAAVAILAGDMMAPLEAALAGRPSGPQIIRVSAPAEAANALKSLLKNGDAVLIKGSNASGMGTVANSLRMWAGGLRQSQKASGMSDVV